MSLASAEALALAQSTEEDINGELSSEVRMRRPAYISILNSSYLVSLNFPHMAIAVAVAMTMPTSGPVYWGCRNFLKPSMKPSIGIRPCKVT